MSIHHFDNLVRGEPLISYLKTLAVPETEIELLASVAPTDKVLSVLGRNFIKKYMFHIFLTFVVVLLSRNAALAGARISP